MARSSVPPANSAQLSKEGYSSKVKNISMIRTSKKIRTDERGLAAFLITAIMMVVVTLIVLGFAQIARREQRVALDRQLSTQAFYAAESGVNDAVHIIQGVEAENNGSATVVSPSNKTSCGPDSNYAASPTLGSNTSYTCLLVATQPTSLVYSGTTSKVINLQDANSSTALSSATISWQNGSGGGDFSGCKGLGIFPTQWPSNCGADVLQIDLVPASALTCSTAAPCSNGVTQPQIALEQQTFTAFLYPQANGAGSVAYPSVPISANSNGPVVAGKCTNGGSCTVIITGLSQNQYFVRFNAMYGIPQNITVTANDGAAVQFINGQAVIDSTGKATDVLRRIEVRTSLNTLNNALFPNYAIQTNGSICKRFYITPIDGTSGRDGNGTPGAPNLDSVAQSDSAACSLN